MAAASKFLVRFLLLALLACGIGVGGAARAADAASAARPTVTDIRVGQDGVRTRLVLELSDVVNGRVFTLDAPARVVIDLPEVGWRLPQRPLPANEGLLARIRYGLFKPGTTRIVLDLTRDATVENAFVLLPGRNNPHRFVIDLQPEQRDAFRAGIDKPRPIAVLRDDAVPPQAAALPPAAAPAPAAPAAVPPPALPVRTAAVAPSAPRKPTPPVRKKVVIIDPGHGGADPGAISVSGAYEKHLTLAIARDLKAELEQAGRYEVVLTRTRDVFIPLRDRVAFARDHGGDLFISLHADAVADPSIKGLSVYTLSQKASDNLAEQLAESENKSDLIGGVDLSRETPEVSNILIDLAQRETMNQSVRFAGLTVSEMGREIALLRNAHRFAGFAVLKSADIPSVLVELGFLSNEEEERALRTKPYRRILTKAIAHATDRFFSHLEEAHKP